MRLTYSAKTTDWALQDFDSSDKGLSQGESEKRLKKYGFNELAAKEIMWWHILARQFKSPFIYLLIFAAVLALVMREPVDGLMILIFVLLNALLGFIEEYHSEKSLKLLKKFVTATARVRRSGKEMLINARELVPGDIVLVETGDVVPADLRFIGVNDLLIDESLISGESVPQNKNCGVLKKAATQIIEAPNMGFMSTHVVAGKGVGIVVCTGRDTAVGGMASLTSETVRESTFEKGIAKFSSFILRMVVLITALLFAANIILKGSEADFGNLILFSIALAVSVIPEALPLVTTLSLSKGALRMAKEDVVVKRLSAVEDLGSIEVLCTDKTGTITENKLEVADVFGGNKKECLHYAAAAASFIGEGKEEPNNSFDLAIWKEMSMAEKKKVRSCARINEVPFDPKRRRNSVIIEEAEGCQLIVRGAVEAVVSLCNHLSVEDKERINKWTAAQGYAGYRTIALAKKSCAKLKAYDEHHENKLNFLGVISFEDPIKPTTKKAIEQAEHLNVKVKIITGDSREVAGAVAVKVGLINNIGDVITGDELEKMKEEQREEAVSTFSVFARISPEQKYMIIQTLQKKFEVGFLGEGINDAPALKLANVALVVDGASDIAREAADIVLLRSSLSVIIDGIKNGREVFANTVKYLKVTLISNFGNFYAIAVASLLVPFLPMLPVQILLLNLLSDFPMVAIATDRVDRIELKRPRSYNVREVVLMAIVLGLVSTIFDFIFFALLVHHDQATLQTGWFIGSVLTEIILIYSIRTHHPFWKAKSPSLPLFILTAAAIVLTLGLPYTAVGQTVFKFEAFSVRYLGMIIGVVITYFVITEILKRLYYLKIGNGKMPN